jgi:hypothetical protein
VRLRNIWTGSLYQPLKSVMAQIAKHSPRKGSCELRVNVTCSRRYRVPPPQQFLGIQAKIVQKVCALRLGLLRQRVLFKQFVSVVLFFFLRRLFP